MALYRASVSGQAPLNVQLGYPSSAFLFVEDTEGNITRVINGPSITAKIHTVTFITDEALGEARFPQIYRPPVQGYITDPPRNSNGVSEGGTTSFFQLIGIYTELPTPPPGLGASIPELPYTLQISYPPGQELVVPPGEAIVFYAYSPPITTAGVGNTWTIIVEWSE